jgi:hypothetical protein
MWYRNSRSLLRLTAAKGRTSVPQLIERRMFRLLTCVLFDLGGSLIDDVDGVDSGPLGWVGR